MDCWWCMFLHRNLLDNSSLSLFEMVLYSDKHLLFSSRIPMTQHVKINSFDHWPALEGDNISTQAIKDRIVDMPQKMLLATHELEDYDKLLFMSQSVQMVIGGLKPATSLVFHKSLINLYRDQGLVTSFDITRLSAILFDYFSLRLSECPSRDADQIQVYIYNPLAVVALTQRTPQLAPYDELDDIHEWVMRCQGQGLHRDFILGLLFGLPISAVKQYVQYMGSEVCRYDGRQLISSYGESYYVWGEELKRDVKIREMLKEKFFTLLASHNLYRDLYDELTITAQPFRALSRELFEKNIYSLKISRDLYQ